MAAQKEKKDKRYKKRTAIKTYITSIIIVQTVLYLVFTAVIAILYYQFRKDTYINVLDTISDVGSDIVSQELSSEGGLDEKLLYSKLVRTAINEELINSLDIVFVKNDGNVVYCKEMIQNGELFSGVCTCDIHKNSVYSSDFIKDVESGNHNGVKVLPGSKERQFYSARPIYNDSAKKSSAGIIIFSAPVTKGYKPSFNKFLAVIIVFTLVYITFTISINTFLGYYTYRPLKSIVKGVRKYTQGDFSYRIKFPFKMMVGEEYIYMADQLNSMAQSIENLDRDHATFISNVAHELKTPMQTISGFIDGILDYTIPKEQTEHYLETVSSEIKRLSKMVNEMLASARMDSGQVKMNIEDLNLIEMILRVVFQYETRIEKKGITMIGLDSMSDIHINADYDMTERIFINLIDNAVKYCPEHGVIKISLEKVNDNPVFSIANTGHLSDEDEDRIFERFYKGDKSRSLDPQSSGLGLFIVQKLVRFQKGIIDVENTDDGLIEFKVIFNGNLNGDSE